MAPSDSEQFTPEPSEWVAVDRQWFKTLASTTEFTVGEKVHLARLAIQQQLVCDVTNTSTKRQLLKRLGLHCTAAPSGFMLVSGNSLLAQYIDFRTRQLTAMEKGVLYGYPQTAILAFSRLIPLSSPQPWPETCAGYFLGGAYSRDHTKQECEFFANQWIELRRQAPDVCTQAEREFESIRTLRMSRRAA